MKKLLLVAVAIGLVAFALPASAQDEDVVGMAIHVKPNAGMKDKLEDGLKKHMALHRDKADPWTWETYEIISGESVGDFVVASYEHKWSDFDNMAVPPAEDGADLKVNIEPYTQYTSVKYLEDLPMHSVPPADGTPPSKFMRLVTVYAKPGKADDYVNAVGKIPAALAKAESDMKYYFSRAVTGGRQPSFLIFFLHDSWADMAPSGTPFADMLEEAYGRAEATSILSSLDQATYDLRTILLAYREDLSYRPSSPSSE